MSLNRVLDEDAIAGLLYEAALDETLWDEAIQAYSESFGGLGAIVLRPGMEAPIISISGALEEGARAYNEGWWEHDLVASTAQKLDLVRPGITFDDDFIPAEVKARHYYFQEFLRPLDIGSVVTVMSQPLGGETIAVNVQRRYGLAPLDPEARDRFARLSRIVSRSLTIRTRLANAEAAQRTLLRTLSSFDCAAAVTDGSGSVVDRNAGFDGLGASGMAVRGGRVRLASPAGQSAFDAALQAVLAGVAAPPGGDTLVLGRLGSAFPLLVRVTPLAGPAGERLRVAASRLGALILVLEPGHRTYPDLATVLVGLGLTPTQARVALLIGGGHGVPEAAETLAIGEETVRSHLKAIFARLRLSKQADLVRFVSRIAPFGRVP